MFGLGFTFFSLFSNAQHGLKKIIVEKYYISDAKDAAVSGGKLPAGSVTYRLFVDMLPGYKFQAVYGIPGHELRIETTTKFFNNEDFGGTTANVIPYRNLKNSTVMLDSWLSVGAGSEGTFGILKSADNGVETIVNANGILQNNDPKAGILVKSQDGLIEGSPSRVTEYGIDSIVSVFNNKTTGSVFSTSNGSWACLGGVVGPDSSNKVLIGQFTTDGIFTFELNIQIGTPNRGVENYVAKYPVGKELQLANGSLRYTVKGENIAPSINITSPLNGGTFEDNSLLPITANASDPDGKISLVEFFVNGVKVGETAKSPFEFKWKLAGGTVVLTAVAIDDSGAMTTSSPVTVTIKSSGR